AEYEKVNDAGKIPIKLRKIRSEDFQVIRQDSRLNFKNNTGDFRTLASLEFNLKTREVIFGADTIPFSSEINAPPGTAFGQWHGYSWEFLKANQGENDYIRVDQLTSRSVKIRLGRTIPEGRFLLHIKYYKIEMGQPKGDMELMGFIQ
ncbi:MAG TPA: hypothetical protein VE035_09245, partial [Puia sp.]|nr:hypothetical protein [Puia sp.]